MSIPIRLQDIAPPGAGIELVAENDPAVIPRVLAIEASSMGEATTIIKKYNDYRLWNQLQSLDSHPEVPKLDGTGDLASKIQKLYLHNDDESGFVEGVESVTLTFPKAARSKVTKQLAGFTPSLALAAGSPFTNSGKSVHVMSRSGTRSLPILEKPLDIDVSDRSVFVCLNNPAKPSWMVRAPRNKPPMVFGPNLRVMGSKEISEKAAWHKVCSWLNARGFAVSGIPYPKGENNFPDFRAWIDDREFDVEMTSVPDMSDWTLKGTFGKLEERISQVAKLPGQTRSQVIDEFLRKCFDKRQRVESGAIGGQRRPCILVISNWSGHEIAEESSRFGGEFSCFDAVMLIESEKVYCIHPS